MTTYKRTTYDPITVPYIKCIETVRVSSKKQDNRDSEDDELARYQRVALDDYVARHGEFEVIEVIEYVESAWSERKIWQQIIELARTEHAVVLVYDLSRWTRCSEEGLWSVKDANEHEWDCIPITTENLRFSNNDINTKLQRFLVFWQAEAENVRRSEISKAVHEQKKATNPNYKAGRPDVVALCPYKDEIIAYHESGISEYGIKKKLTGRSYTTPVWYSNTKKGMIKHEPKVITNMGWVVQRIIDEYKASKTGTVPRWRGYRKNNSKKKPTGYLSIQKRDILEACN